MHGFACGIILRYRDASSGKNREGEIANETITFMSESPLLGTLGRGTTVRQKVTPLAPKGVGRMQARRGKNRVVALAGHIRHRSDIASLQARRQLR